MESQVPKDELLGVQSCLPGPAPVRCEREARRANCFLGGHILLLSWHPLG